MFNENENNDDNENLFFEQRIDSPINKLYSESNNDIEKSQAINSIFKVNQSNSINNGINSIQEDNLFISNSQDENSIFFDNISRPSETKISSNDVFSVSKNMSIRKKVNQKMKKKAERIKSILKEKQKRTESTMEKAMTFAEKQEKKILRNRMSAQRSRDRQKSKMVSLELMNNTLIEETEKLKQQISQNETVINYLTDNIRRCGNCSTLLNTINSQSLYISDNDSISISGFKNWVGGFSVIGLFCLIAMFMLIGSPGTTTHNKRVTRQLEKIELPHLDYEPTNASYFPIIKYTEDISTNINEEAYYDTNNANHQNTFNKTIDSYPIRKRIMEIINKIYPIEENNSNKKETIK